MDGHILSIKYSGTMSVEQGGVDCIDFFFHRPHIHCKHIHKSSHLPFVGWLCL